jgi:hypothetical protein
MISVMNSTEEIDLDHIVQKHQQKTIDRLPES